MIEDNRNKCPKLDLWVLECLRKILYLLKILARVKF